MTDVRGRLIVLGLIPPLILFGALVTAAPTIAVGVIAALLVAAVLTLGTEALFVGTLVAFPLVPSQFSLGVSSLYPQRLILVLLLILLLADREIWRATRWRVERLGTALWLFAAFLSVGLASAVLSPLHAAALGGVGFYLLHVGGVFMIGLLTARKAQSSRYWLAVSVAVIGVSLISMLEYLVPGNPLTSIYPPAYAAGQFIGDQTRAIGTRISGPLGNPVALGSFALMTFPFVLRAATDRSKLTARAGQVALAGLLVCLLMAQTRMAILATPIALVVWLALGQHRRNITIALAATALLAVGTFGVSTFKAQGEILQQALSYRGQTSSRDPAENSIAARSSIYQTGWRAFQDRPLVGFGFRLPTEYAQSGIFQPYGQPYAFESYMVALPVESGALGVLLLLSFAGSLVVAAFRWLPDRGDRATVVSAIVGSAVLAVGANPFDVPISYFWLLMGLTFGVGLSSRMEPPEQGARPAQ
jgi:hypothetical protein